MKKIRDELLKELRGKLKKPLHIQLLDSYMTNPDAGKLAELMANLVKEATHEIKKP